MEAQVIYYKLLHDKQMGDGHMIPQGHNLILIKSEGDMMFFEFHNEEEKVLFWANENEVECVDVLTEDLSEERINQLKSYQKGEFL